MAAVGGCAAKDFGGSPRRFNHVVAKEPVVNSLRQIFETSRKDTPPDGNQRDEEVKTLALATVVFWSLIFALGGVYLA